MTSLFTSLETNWKLTTYSVIVSLLRFQIKVESMNKMTNATVETVYIQDEIPVILNTSLELETYIKGHHVYKEVLIPDVGEKLNVLMEPDNRVDRFSVYLRKDRTVVGHLKKRYTLKDEEGLQVPCKIIIAGCKYIKT